eukprot:4889475-Pyramimonas_sp.AAC.1
MKPKGLEVQGFIYPIPVTPEYVYCREGSDAMYAETTPTTPQQLECYLDTYTVYTPRFWHMTWNVATTYPISHALLRCQPKSMGRDSFRGQHQLTEVTLRTLHFALGSILGEKTISAPSPSLVTPARPSLATVCEFEVVASSRDLAFLVPSENVEAAPLFCPRRVGPALGARSSDAELEAQNDRILDCFVARVLIETRLGFAELQNRTALQGGVPLPSSGPTARHCSSSIALRMCGCPQRFCPQRLINCMQGDAHYRRWIPLYFSPQRC